MKIDPENPNRYLAITVPQLSPKKVHPDIHKGCEVTINTEIGAWFSFDKSANADKAANKCGLFFSFNKVTFHIGDQTSFNPEAPLAVKAPPAKKRKTKASVAESDDEKSI